MANEDFNFIQNENQKIISYQKLRTFIGFIGLLLPVITVAGSAIMGAGKYSWQHSISHYYYSKMHIIFVASLCVLGGFLITYKGGDKWENRVSNLAGICAFGIAAFPTCFDGFQPFRYGNNQYLMLLTPVNNFWGGVHFAFAGALFICFAIFCLYFFQIPDEDYKGIDAKKFLRRKKLYKICGWGIIISMVMIAIFSFIIHVRKGLFEYSTFIFETTSLWSFGFAWLIKGSEALKQTRLIKHFVSSFR